MSESLAKSLKHVLADTYAIYLKTQNYHWNVEGPHFRSLHLMFEDHYDDLFKAKYLEDRIGQEHGGVPRK